MTLDDNDTFHVPTLDDLTDLTEEHRITHPGGDMFGYKFADCSCGWEGTDLAALYHLNTHTERELAMSWKDLTDHTRQAMVDHATSSPECLEGEFTVRTLKDNRTDPPKVTQDIKCDTCSNSLW